MAIAPITGMLRRGLVLDLSIAFGMLTESFILKAKKICRKLYRFETLNINKFKRLTDCDQDSARHLDIFSGAQAISLDNFILSVINYFHKVRSSCSQGP
ncbi:hypothetical protein Golomagni_02651 [Golovinomyces magnicellulatus]|nr:hypothetical protein Golomagni_02651 [Golovinomyces magnicellulatus]